MAPVTLFQKLTLHTETLQTVKRKKNLKDRKKNNSKGYEITQDKLDQDFWPPKEATEKDVVRICKIMDVLDKLTRADSVLLLTKELVIFKTIIF